MSFHRALLLSLAILAGVVPTAGQIRGGGNIPSSKSSFVIAGTVRDDTSQQTLENVRVDLKAQSGSTVNTTFTRGNGEFEFPNLGNGEYIVEVIMKGYQPYRDVIDLLDSSRRGYTVFLERDRNAPTPAGDALVSAHELRVPQKAREEFQKGLQLLYGKSDPRAAIGQFQRAIKDFPDYYEAYAQEGNAYFATGDAVSGEAALKKSIEMSSGHYADAYFIYAGTLNNISRFAEAADEARKGLGLNDASWQGHLELARALTELKQPEEAEQSAEAAQKLQPDQPQIYLILANVHIQRQDWQALQVDLTEYLKLVRTGPQADQARQTLDKLKQAFDKAQSQPTGQDTEPAPQP